VSELYRVGRHQVQNVYRGEEYIGVMFSPEDAALVVAALNRTDAGEKLEPIALIDYTGDRWDKIGPNLYRLRERGATYDRAFIEWNFGPVTEVWT